MIELYLTRHGETEENAQGILQGHLPGHLSRKGLEQARELGEQLQDIKFDVIMSSDLKRAMETAAFVCQGRRQKIVPCPLLRERDWGELTGMRVSSLNIKPEDFPKSVENPVQLQERSRKFLIFLLENYDGKRILAVGHGYFDRCIEAELEGKTPHDVPRWGNTEVRTFSIDHLKENARQATTDEVSAN